jgi:hypothetical protein
MDDSNVIHIHSSLTYFQADLPFDRVLIFGSFVERAQINLWDIRSHAILTNTLEPYFVNRGLIFVEYLKL